MEENQETVAQRALRVLEQVPEEKWIRHFYTNTNGLCCGIGHYNRLTSADPQNYMEANCIEWPDIPRTIELRRVSMDYFIKEKMSGADISDVNNFTDINPYEETTPKARVLHLLKDMVEAGY